MNNEISYELLYGEPFSRRDFNSVNKLLVELYEGSGKPPRQVTIERYQEVTRDEYPLVARLPDQRIIGMATLTRCNKFSREAYSVEDVIVTKKYRGRGVATGLMEKLHWLAGEMGIDILDLHSSRSQAILLYEKLGYKVRTDSKLMRRTK